MNEHKKLFSNLQTRIIYFTVIVNVVAKASP